MSHVVDGRPPEASGRGGSSVEEDEPYTIKCVCPFDDDDGLTVFCERCETWQHIECYYPTRKVPDVHNCVDCEPRPVDVKRALERQRRRREPGLGPERKVKRTAAKASKRKPKEGAGLGAGVAVTQSNGVVSTVVAADRRNGALASDHPPPAKRPKTNHRTSLAEVKRTLPLLAEARSTQATPPGSSSAATTVTPPDSTADIQSPVRGHRPEDSARDPPRPSRDDGGDSSSSSSSSSSPAVVQVNHFSDLALASTLATWIHDRDALRRAVGDRGPSDVLQLLDPALDSIPLLPLAKRTVDDASGWPSATGRHRLTVEAYVQVGAVVGELKGLVGHLHDYRRDPANRWSDRRHPEPFVFLHPHLPLYIDTRREGTRCRYVRRSCRPNTVMRTIITNGTEYHFCFCASEPLRPGCEITIGWEPDRDLGVLLDRAGVKFMSTGPHPPSGVRAKSLSFIEQDVVADWVDDLLDHHGGCACGDAARCALALLGRRRRSVDTVTTTTTTTLPTVHVWTDDAGRFKKGRPTGSSRPSPARAGSATATDTITITTTPPSSSSTNGQIDADAHQNHRPSDDDGDPRRSSTTSTPTQSHDRHGTPPLTHPSGDVSATMNATPELSDREKRKIAAVERTFEQLEQEHQHQAQRRRKLRHGVHVRLPTPLTVGPNLGASDDGDGRSFPDLDDAPAPSALSSVSTSGSATPAAPVSAESIQAVGATPPDLGSTTVTILSPSSNNRLSLVTTVGSDTTAPPSVTPSSARVSSSSSSSSYVDVAVQTDPIREAWYRQRLAPILRRPVVSLTTRLLMRCHADRVRYDEEEEGNKRPAASFPPDAAIFPSSSAMDVDPPPTNGVDIHAVAAPSSPPPPPTVSSSPGETKFAASPPPSPMTNHQPPQPPDRTLPPSDERHVSRHPRPPPSVMAPSDPPSTGATSPPAVAVTVPSSVVPSPVEPSPRPSRPSVLSPSPSIAAAVPLPSPAVTVSASAMASVTQPNPIKKKLSLSDYVSRKCKAEAAAASSTSVTDKSASRSSPTSTHASSLASSSPLRAEIKLAGSSNTPTTSMAPWTPLAVAVSVDSSRDPRLP